jgi:phosphoribosylamine--glycine ligase
MENSPKPQSEEALHCTGKRGKQQRLEKTLTIKATDFEALKVFALEREVNMIVVGPEDPLVQDI